MISALESEHGSALSGFVAVLAPAIIPTNAIRLTAAIEASSSPLCGQILSGVALVGKRLPPIDAATIANLHKLLARPDTTAAALSLTLAWDRDGALDAAIRPVAKQLLSELGTGVWTPSQRSSAINALLTFMDTRDAALTKIGVVLTNPQTPLPIQKALLTAVGQLTDQAANRLLIDTFVKTKSALVFETIIQREEFSLSLLKAIETNRITPAAIGPANIDRLLRHPVRRVNRQAAGVLGTSIQTSAEKDALIAKLLPAVEKPGNIENGRKLFAAACAICHKFGDVGQLDVGPPLAGIGSHGAAELLQAIVDPNRSVEPNYWQWDITTKQKQTYSGVIIRETNSGITIRNQGGDFEINTADIAKRENTRRSLMPEGFGGLGETNLRDLISYLTASAKAPPTAAATPAAAEDPTPKSGGPRDAPLPALEPIVWEPGKTRVLMISGGSSHQFGQFFGGTDRATLKAAGFSVNYTEDRDQATAALAAKDADVAIISVNRKFFDTPAYRQALMAFAASGKGIIMHHPGTWYGYKDWPELNAQIVGGGARGHDKIAAYSVDAVQPHHPIMRGVPASFTVEDELYYINAEPAKTPPNTAPITVLAQSSPSQKFRAPHPVIWITQHPQSRIVGLTIGHDERVHDLIPFKTLLTNAVKWASGK